MTKAHPLSNNIRGEDTIDSVSQTLDDAFDLLRPSAGPNALYVAQAISGSEFQGSEYTKDGITIAKRARAETAVQEYVRNELVFVGESVDRVCHDGTTTAMLFFAALTSGYLSVVKGMDRRERRRASNMMEHYIDALVASVKKSKLTVESLTKLHNTRYPNDTLTEDQVKERVAYWTALTSTKGDHEFAAAITESVMSYPKELYSYGRVGIRSYEEKEHVIVDTVGGQNADVVLNTKTAIAEMRGNDDLGVDWHLDDACFCITNETLAPGQPISDFLFNWLASKLFPEEFEGKNLPPYPEINKPFIIFAKTHSDQRMMNACRQWNKLHPDQPVLLFNLMGYNDEVLKAVSEAIPAMSGSGNLYDLSALNKGGMFEDCIIDCKFDTVGNDGLLSNLYTKVEGNAHPFLHDESKESYHRIRGAIIDFIQGNKKRHVKWGDQVVEQLSDMLRMMSAQNLKDVYAAGTIHEALAGRSVLQDGLGATISVLQHGFTLSGYVKLYASVLQREEHLKDFPADEVFDDLTSETLEALSRVLQATYEIEEDEVSHYFDNTVEIDEEKLKVLSYNEDLYDVLTVSNIIESINDEDWKDELVVVQPIRGFEEQLKRIRDIVIKLVRTETIMMVQS